MRFSEDRKKIVTTLTGWLAEPSSLPVVRVLKGMRPENEHLSFFMEVPRLIVVLEGRGTFLTIEDGKESMFDVAAGQVLFLAPCTWICPVPRMAYRSLGVIMRPVAQWRPTAPSRAATLLNGARRKRSAQPAII
jgi:hypothetical protein